MPDRYRIYILLVALLWYLVKRCVLVARRLDERFHLGPELLKMACCGKKYAQITFCLHLEAGSRTQKCLKSATWVPERLTFDIPEPNFALIMIPCGHKRCSKIKRRRASLFLATPATPTRARKVLKSDPRVPGLVPECHF